jgi:hypothetical protein
MSRRKRESHVISARLYTDDESDYRALLALWKWEQHTDMSRTEIIKRALLALDQQQQPENENAVIDRLLGVIETLQATVERLQSGGIQAAPAPPPETTGDDIGNDAFIRSLQKRRRPRRG